jgi:hypothetical protein
VPVPVPGCERLYTHDLSARTLSGDGSDTAVAFSPDGALLAVGAAGGQLLVLGEGGEVVAERFLAETLLRDVQFSADGRVLWVAEQSADAFVYALRPDSLEELGRYRLADDVESSPPPRADDPWGVYQLPAAYHLVPQGADVVAVAAHGWDTPAGRRNASRVVWLSLGEGGVRSGAAWPPEGAADAVFGAAAANGDTLAVAIRRSAAGPPPAGLPIDGVLQLALPGLTVSGQVVLPVLAGFDSVFVWDALALQPGRLVFGTGDGRLASVAADGELRVVPYAVPVTQAAVPVAASIGTLRAVGDDVFTVTSRSWSPGSVDGSLVPATLHPEERSLAAWRWSGATLAPRWAWRGPYELGGLATSATEVVVAAGPRTDARTDLFGFLRFARGGDGTPRAVCSTEGAVHGEPSLTTDGRVAVVEVPSVVGTTRSGPYRVSVYR